MKLKLFVTSIVALLYFVAYQQYKVYSTVKSVDSYESCITAKGSIIQESYPATCITRLGNRFTQPVVMSWTDFSSKKYQFSITYPSNWLVSSPDPTGNFENSGTLYFYDERKSPTVQVFLEVSSAAGTTFPLQIATILNYDWVEKIKEDYQFNGIMATKISGISIDAFGKHEKSVVLFEKGEYIYKLQTVGLYDQAMFNQILTSFKFTD